MGDVFAPWHIILLVIVLLLLFGSRRLPGAAKSLGQSMHIFKQSVSGLNADPDSPDASSPGYTAGQALPPPAQPLQPAQPAQPPQPAQDGTQAQLEELQRQVSELQRQAAAGNAGQQSQPL